MTKVSVITVCYYSGDILFDCINSILNEKIAGEIIVVINGISEKDLFKLKKIASIDTRVIIITTPRNLGFGQACNRGAMVAQNENLVFLNPDAFIKSGALNEFYTCLQKFENAIIGGLIFDKNGNEQQGARRNRLTLSSALLNFLGLGGFNLNKTPLPETPIHTDVISGAFFAINKRFFIEIGGFDEKYFLHFEDIDLCEKAWRHGGQVIFTPNAMAIHIGGTSKATKFFIVWHKIRSLLIYLWKFEGFLGRLALIFLAPFICAGMMLRMIINYGRVE